MYEVVWTRMMTHVFGTTAIAVGTVLAAFMAGLAAGAWVIGKIADRHPDPLRVYAYLEFGVGFAALIAHFLLGRITPAYLAVYELFGRADAALGVARFVLAFVLVMAPTMLMGATLPVLARFVVTRLSTAGLGLSTLYTINTAGAVAGSMVTGFYLIGALGIHATVYLAVLGNLGIGGLAWYASSRAGEAAAPAAEPTEAASPTASPVFRLLLLGFALSGMTSFAYEIFWMRSLVFLVGNSTYAVTTMLVAFLTGIALGGFLVRFVIERVADRVALFGWIQLAIAASATVALPVLFAVADPQRVHIFLGSQADQVGKLMLTRLGVSLLVMLVPTTLIGATFPLVGRIAVQDLRQTASSVGRIYAVNTVGNVVGALLPGLVLLAWLGIQKGILAMAILNAVVGLAMLLSRPLRGTRRAWAIPAAVVLLALALGQAPLAFQFPTESQHSWDRVLFYREGPSATTKVLIDPDTRLKSMSVDGITIGGNGFTDYKQQLLAHLPKLFVDDVSRELSVGLGSAILVGESARHSRVREIVCLEIEPSVAAGAAYFARESHDVLEDPRLKIVVDDVANHLRTTGDRYNVISADEKTAEDYASNGFSFSREYYDLLGSRLAPGGMVFQWVPTSLPPAQFAMVLRTFTASFPHVIVWYSPPALLDGPSNTILIGSNDAIRPDHGRARRAFESDPDAFEGIARYGLTTAESVLAPIVARGDAIREAVRDAPENTLVHPRYEFFSPSEYAPKPWQRVLQNHDFLMGLRRAETPALFSEFAAGTGDTGRLSDAFAAEQLYLDAYRGGLAGMAEDEVFRGLESALALAPWNESLRARIFLLHWKNATRRFNDQDLQGAVDLMRHALSVYGKHAHARVELAIVLMQNGALGPAEQQARLALDTEPRLVLAHRVLADTLVRAGRLAEGRAQLQALLQIEPQDAGALEALSRLPLR